MDYVTGPYVPAWSLRLKASNSFGIEQFAGQQRAQKQTIVVSGQPLRAANGGFGFDLGTPSSHSTTATTGAWLTLNESDPAHVSMTASLSPLIDLASAEATEVLPTPLPTPQSAAGAAIGAAATLPANR
jgi:hypothetical protein